MSVQSGAQTGNKFIYRFSGNLQDKPVIAGEGSIVINYSLPELSIDNITNDNGIFTGFPPRAIQKQLTRGNLNCRYSAVLFQFPPEPDTKSGYRM